MIGPRGFWAFLAPAQADGRWTVLCPVCCRGRLALEPVDPAGWAWAMSGACSECYAVADAVFAHLAWLYRTTVDQLRQRPPKETR